jgi:hypothetical protein
MSLLEIKRARLYGACLFVLIAAAAHLAIGHPYESHVFAAKPAIAGEDARAAAKLQRPIPHSSAAPVLVELFTSEGCSDCPPADTLLAHLQQDQPVPSANIIALEEHVDYWDHLGWRDRFSSHDLTERQGAYTQRLHLDDNYTPQMIVGGTEQFVGSDSAHAVRAIASAVRSPKLAISLSPISFSGSHANGTVSVSANPAAPSNADLYAALVQRSATTNVLRGENGGHTLHHVSTVLALQKIGDSRNAAAPLSFSLNVPQSESPANLAVVVFAQQPGQGAILGVASSAMGSAH